MKRKIQNMLIIPIAYRSPIKGWNNSIIPIVSFWRLCQFCWP